MVRWPGHIKPDTISRQMMSGLDWFPTLLAAAGDTNIGDRLLKGVSVGGKTFKNHLDGYNFLPYLTGQAKDGPRHEFFYFNDDGLLVAMRHDDWKVVFCEQREPGGYQVWANPFTCLRVPKLFNLRMDPYERADIVSDQYYDWSTKNIYLVQYAVNKVPPFLATFKDFPPSQRPASFSIDQMTDALMKSLGGTGK
jgi:arylsulfatase A-like enzyme